MQALIHDIRLALRFWRRSPTVAVAAASSLALGIAAVTVIFSAVSATLLRPLPGTTTEALVRVQGHAPQDAVLVVSYPEFSALRDSDIFASLTAERINTIAISLDGNALSVGGAAVSRDYFDVLGVEMARGPGFAAGDPRVAPEPVAIISQPFWRSAFAGDPDVLGRNFRAGGLAFTVVGVAHQDFSGAFPGFRTSVWVPLDFVEAVFPTDGSLLRMDDRFLNLLGTVSIGDDPASISERLTRLAASLAEHPDFSEDRTFRMTRALGVHPSLRPIAGAILTGMFLIVATVLLIACANVANLLMARAMARRAEMAARLALGARRFQIVRQILTESIVLGLIGAFGGIVLSMWTLRLLSAVKPPLDAPVGLDLKLDPSTLSFAILAGIGSGIVFGILPALRGSAVDPATDMRSGAAGAGGGRGWTQSVLIVVQLSVTAVLLVGAGLMIRSVSGIGSMDPGFERESIATAEADIRGHDELAGKQYWEIATAAALSVAGVQDAALGLFVHLGGRADQMRVASAEGPGDPWPMGAVNYSIIEGGLLDLLDISLLVGRTFPEEPEADAAEVIVNEALAEALWPGTEPIGRTLRVERRNGELWIADVVGVTETVKVRRLNEAPTPFFYVPYGPWYRPDMVLHVRAGPGAEAPLDDLRSRLGVIDVDVPITVRPLDAHTSVAVTLARMLRAVLGAAGLMALLIASVGVFGVVSYSTQQRTREIAIRMAIGASGERVQRMVVAQSLRVVAAGLGLGLLLALVATRALAAFLYGVSPTDVPTLLAVGAVIVSVAGAASWLPARWATRAMEITDALRQD